MDRTRLMKFYAKLYSFNKSNDKSLKQAEEIKQEAYDICMAEGANTDNYSPNDNGYFVSARTTIQMIYNALQEDFYSAKLHQELQGDWKLSWYGFQFAERELSEGFFRNTLDQSWDLDKCLDGFIHDIKKIKSSQSYTDGIYKEFVGKNPWIDEVLMSDKDLFLSLKRDLGEKEADDFVYHNHFNKPYDRICINMVKYYYETGEFREVGNGYIDDNMESMCEYDIHKTGSFQLWHSQ